MDFLWLILESPRTANRRCLSASHRLAPAPSLRPREPWARHARAARARRSHRRTDHCLGRCMHGSRRSQTHPRATRARVAGSASRQAHDRATGLTGRPQYRTRCGIPAGSGVRRIHASASPRFHTLPSTITSISLVPGRANADCSVSSSAAGSVTRIASSPSDRASPTKSTDGSVKSMPTNSRLP